MDQEQLKKKIELILSDLHTSTKNFENADEINLGILSANARYLFEHVDALRKIVAKEADVLKVVQVAPVITEAVVAVPEVKIEPVFVPEPVEVKEAVVEMITEPITNNPQSATRNTEPEPASLNPEFPGINDRYKKEGSTLNERIAKPIEKNVGQMNHKPVIDLKTAIGINDKFLFINELFKGDKEKYSAIINQLSDFTTLAEANDYLKTNCAEQYNWEKKQDLVDRFYTILSRKFTV